jgi:hypothetical protein
MIAGVVFLAAQAALALLGGGVAWHPTVRTFSLPARAAVALCGGCVGLTLGAMLLSLAGIPWSIPALALPLAILSFAAAATWRKLPVPVLRRSAPGGGVVLGSVLLGGMALLYLAACFGSTAASSTDFLFFWGVKAVRFASNRGIDAAFLGHRFTMHATPDYPPLVPIVDAWGVLAAGGMPWRLAPFFSALWFFAAVPILFERCRRRLGGAAAAAVTAFWTVALSISLVASYSAAGAEPSLLFFESVAVAWLLTEEPGESRFIPILALCGAALTKVEGLLAVVLIVLGVAIRDGVRGSKRDGWRAPAMLVAPVASVFLWFLYQKSWSLPVGYRGHGDLLVLYTDQLGTILKSLLRRMDAGSYWLAWALPAALVLRRAAAWRAAAPALLLAVGLAAFLVFDYLHDKDDPSERIEWTAPRVMQPALSATILAAGVLTSMRPLSRESGERIELPETRG